MYSRADMLHQLIMKLTLLISDQIILINGQIVQWSWTALTIVRGQSVTAALLFSHLLTQINIKTNH